MINSRHSTGALYLTICNNPRNIRFKRIETTLLSAFLGEPLKEALNYLLEPTVTAFSKLYRGEHDLFLSCQKIDHLIHIGRYFNVTGMQAQKLVHTHLHLNCSNLPASRKAVGLAGATCEDFMCPFYKCTVSSLQDPDSYNPSSS